MSYFAISAPQTVVLPNGTTLNFRVNAADSSQVELHVTGERDGAAGTWMIPFRRNSGAAGSPEFSAIAPAGSDAPPNQARIDAMDDSHPGKAELKARQEAADKGQQLDADGRPVDDHPLAGAVPRDLAFRDPSDAAYRNPLAGYKNVNDDAVRNADNTYGKPKVDPVHGVINTAGADDHAAKPKEGTNADTPLQDRKDQASVGLKPAP